MLARVAQTLYWIARDLERAESVARLLEVGQAAALERDSSDAAGDRLVWEPLVEIAGDLDAFLATHRRADERSVPWFLTFGRDNPHSIVGCLNRARENARSVRDRLPTEVWEGINHRRMPAIYPPLFQLAVRGVTAVHDSITAMKSFLVLCEIVALGLLALVLRRRGLGAERLLVLAWSPLALVEIAGSGHNEAFGMMWLVAALLALDLDRPLLSALAASAGFMAKLLPGLVAVAWARRYRPGHVLAALGLAALLVWPYLDAGRTLFFSLSRFARFWRFNETLFAPLAELLGSHAAAVRAGVAITLALALLLAWRRTEPVAAALAVVAASLLLSPNVLPWYPLWFVPLLVVRDEPAALLFTGTVSLAYSVYPDYHSGEPWKLGWGMRALEYLPCLLVLLLTHWPRRVLRAPS